MKAVVTVVGRDTVGILAKVSSACAEHNANIIDVTQSVMQDLFTMVMLVDISDTRCDMAHLRTDLNTLADDLGMQISLMHEDIFNSMHRI